MKKRIYPHSLFVFGILTNLVRTFFVLIAILLFVVLGLAGIRIFFTIAWIVALSWLLYAIVEQVLIRNSCIRQSNSAEFNDIMDRFLNYDDLDENRGTK